MCPGGPHGRQPCVITQPASAVFAPKEATPLPPDEYSRQNKPRRQSGTLQGSTISSTGAPVPRPPTIKPEPLPSSRPLPAQAGPISGTPSGLALWHTISLSPTISQIGVPQGRHASQSSSQRSNLHLRHAHRSKKQQPELCQDPMGPEGPSHAGRGWLDASPRPGGDTSPGKTGANPACICTCARHRRWVGG